MSKRKRAEKLVGQHLYFNGEKKTPVHVEAVVFEVPTFGGDKPALSLRCRLLYESYYREVILKYTDTSAPSWVVPAAEVASLPSDNDLAFDRVLRVFEWLAMIVQCGHEDLEIDPFDNLVPSGEVFRLAHDRLARVRDRHVPGGLTNWLRECFGRAPNMRQYVIARTMLALQMNTTVLG